MVKLLVGRKGSGKTKQMIELANEMVEDYSTRISSFIDGQFSTTLSINTSTFSRCIIGRGSLEERI